MRRPLVGGAALAAAVVHAGPALSPVVPAVARALSVRLRQPGDDGVAITFDDGPHPQGTVAALEALRAAGARATFFLAGEQVERRPALAAEIVAAGHGVELHCHRHRNQLRLSAAQIRADAERGRAAIEDACATEVTRFRPPYGIFSAGGLRAVRGLGLRPVLWSLWGRDWTRSATAKSVTRRATAAARAGDILLLHDADYYSVRGSWARTVAALPNILAELDSRGLKPTVLRR